MFLLKKVFFLQTDTLGFRVQNRGKRCPLWILQNFYPNQCLGFQVQIRGKAAHLSPSMFLIKVDVASFACKIGDYGGELKTFSSNMFSSRSMMSWLFRFKQGDVLPILRPKCFHPNRCLRFFTLQKKRGDAAHFSKTVFIQIDVFVLFDSKQGLPISLRNW